MILHRKGLIYGSEHFGRKSSHAQVPTAIVLGDVVRVYYSARDGANRSYVTFADFDRDDPTRLIRSHDVPVLEPSKPGTFDADGTMPGHVLEDAGRLLMFYTGWNQRVTTPYHNSIGLAESVDGGATFRRVHEGPVMDRTAAEPYLAVTPCVLRANDGFRAWYNSGTGWREVGGKMEAVYVIKYAESSDGVHWTRDARQVISSRFDDEVCSNPTVFRSGPNYHMLFCARGIEDYRTGSRRYRLGYAASKDGIDWRREDERLEFAGATGDWESHMQCYPFHLEVDGRHFVLYNGNGFGQTGFGLAEVEI